MKKHILAAIAILFAGAAAAGPLESWSLVGNGFTAPVDDAQLLSEYPGSSGVMLVSPEAFETGLTLRFEVLPLNPETVLVAMLSVTEAGTCDALDFPPDYDGDIGFLSEGVNAYFFAFHNAAHERTPFVRKHPFVRGESEDLDAAGTNVMTTQWHRVEASATSRGVVTLHIDGVEILNAADQSPLPGGHAILRVRGTKTHTAAALVRNLEIVDD